MGKTYGKEVAITSVLADGGTKTILTKAKEPGGFLGKHRIMASTVIFMKTL